MDVARKGISKTARLVALARAAGALERNPDIRNPDYLARHFIIGAYRLALLPGIRDAIKAVCAHRVSPGMYEYHTARTRFIDNVFHAAIVRRVAQIVILGAGLDSRAYRFARTLHHATVYELDREEDSRVKQELIRKLGRPPANVRYVSADLRLPGVSESLVAKGWDRNRPSLFICEGLFYYLPSDAVENVFRTMATAAPGTHVVFDYVRAAVLASPQNYHGAAQFLSFVAKHGEPVRSSFVENGVEKTLGQHGFQLQTHLYGRNIADHVWRGNIPIQMPRMCDIFGLALAIRRGGPANAGRCHQEMRGST